MSRRIKESIKNIVREVLTEHDKSMLAIRKYNIAEKHIMRDTIDVINEECGISNEVLNATNKLITDVSKHILSKSFRYDGNGVGYIQTKFNETLFGRKVPINLIVYDITDEEYIRNINEYNISYRVDTKELFFVIPYNNGKIDSPIVKATIQHEVNHCFQDKVRGWCGTMSQREDELYYDAELLGDETNKIAYAISMVIYLSFKIEQESFGNELYSELINNRNIGWDEVYKNSEIFKQLRFLKDCEELFLDKSNYDEIAIVLDKLKKYKLNHNKLIKLCNSTYNSLFKRVGKIISLAINRYNLKKSIILR